VHDEATIVSWIASFDPGNFDMDEEIIKTDNLSRNFEKAGVSIPVIKNLNLSINKGEFIVVMGNSGSGKSTLLYLLSGLDYVSSGRIWINGLPIHNSSESELAKFRRNNIGFVFQENNLIPNLTLKENIMVAGFLSDKEKNSVRGRAENILKQLGISSQLNKLPSQVSGGELQRSAIARAVINSPLIILADEPTGSLNSEASERVLECLSRLHQQGQCILMVTHDLKSALCADRVLFLKDGEIIAGRKINKENDPAMEERALFDWLKANKW
jgi:putative ABC transport system ATP-binding protein